MASGIGFGVATILMKSFLLELKHRDDGQDTEETIAIELLEVPDLKNASLTLNYLLTCLWALLEEDYREENINQVFVYNAKNCNDLIVRVASANFTDEQPTYYQPPTEKKFKDFKIVIAERIRKLYGATTGSVSYVRARLPIQSTFEYDDYYQKELLRKKTKPLKSYTI